MSKFPEFHKEIEHGERDQEDIITDIEGPDIASDQESIENMKKSKKKWGKF